MRHPLRRNQNRLSQNELGQFNMGIKTDDPAPLTNVKRKLNAWETKLEVMPFWRNFSFVFMAISSLLIPLGLTVTIFLNFDKLGSNLALFYDPQTQTKEPIEKGIVIFIPLGFAIANLLLLNILTSVFQFDRRLAQLISYSVNIANILFLIAFMQILSLRLL